ncbi:MAG: Npun_F5749 family FMN-dependent PPOX-type flavoprotein [Leptolyngbyaceae bacterium]|nr:Npun_F5749 family FMN-dependent PPOX-type flavoprotein [Leptolyngbyaceae bacterium]
MTIAPWRSPLSRALHRNRALPNARYGQLATVRPDGTPANRTIVFRGFVTDCDDLQFVTDRRSEKIQDLHHQAIAELCWYFPKTREQFRLRGPITVIGATTEAPSLQTIHHQLWQSLSDNARLQFSWPHPKHRRTDATGFETRSPQPLDPPPDFCSLLLSVTQVDHLELRGNPQNRWLYQRDSNHEWVQQAVNP